MKGKRVTQQDVAAKVGVHRGTVSLAFKHHPSIPEKTRERILQAAEELGYRPDPMLSALAMYRSSQHESRFKGVLGWLYIKRYADDNSWQENRTYSQYFAGARKRAEQYGYQVEVFDFDGSKVSPQRIASILRARNVNGILLCPQPSSNTVMDFVWDDFSFVTFGYTLRKPELHTVTATQYRSMVQTMNKMHEYGYRRIGFVFGDDHDERTDHNFLAGYLAAQHQLGEQPLVLKYEWRNVGTLPAQLKKNKVQAVVTGTHLLASELRECGVRVPEDVAVACPVLAGDRDDVAGVIENSYHIGEVAVDRLTNLVMRGDRGIPEMVQRTHIEGKWVEGKSLPRLADRVAGVK
ncbi:LacI family DNA-binding transcriptional regulator [Ruficoccus sp. ZRK36]|uniref:LacI family DNA-binding transcriptional regulator n=1 Tax=Ruficoccus sp. ZRK36 TaxID=2866311 RepID=UPI001C72D389|nr:LacI family DNA-binding transcriptional regulator [Ruficoccus sp. ZRK36]QYY35234.1 LacI family transcriptional regulator [Ruficoccus sp. ZRK36]